MQTTSLMFSVVADEWMRKCRPSYCPLSLQSPSEIQVDGRARRGERQERHDLTVFNTFSTLEGSAANHLQRERTVIKVPQRERVDKIRIQLAKKRIQHVHGACDGRFSLSHSKSFNFCGGKGCPHSLTDTATVHCKQTQLNF